MFVYSRKFLSGAYTGMPRPLAVRSDSLLVQCMIAAAIFFVPQDAAVLGLGVLLGRSNSRNVNAPVAVADPQTAVDNFLKSRGLTADKVDVSQGKRTWEVTINTIYQ